MSIGDLLYSDTEEALRDSVRHLFAERCSPEVVTRAYDPAPQDFSDVWRRLAGELGVAGLLVPESLGGAGAGAREAAVVMEEIGRAVAPVPFLSSAVLATVALLRAGETETLSALAQGELTAALVVPLSTAPGDSIVGVGIGADGLTGTVSSVAGAGDADVLVVPVAGRDGLEMHTVVPRRLGCGDHPAAGLDMTRPLANVRFSAASSTAPVGPQGASGRGRRTGDGCGAAGVRAAGAGAVVFRDHAGLCQAAQAVRPRDRLLSGDQASVGGSVV